MKHARNSRANLVTFSIDDRTFALPLEAVTRVEQAVSVTPVPGAPKHLLGVINHRGRILPVINLRIRLGLPERPIDVNDQLLLISCHMGTLVLPVDQVQGVLQAKFNSASSPIVEDCPEIDTIIATGSSITMITSPDNLLKPKETLELYEVANDISTTSALHTFERAEQ